MPSMPKLLVMSLCAAMIVAGSAEARRMGGGRSVGAKPPEVPAAAMNSAGTMNAGARVQSPAARAMTGVDVRNAVVVGVAAGATTAMIRNANADSRSDPRSDASSQGPAAVPASTHTLASVESKLLRKDAELARERAAEMAATKQFDESAAKAAEKAAEKSPADLARERKNAEDKAAAKAREDARKMKLAREQSCRIEPVMTDKMLANCQKVWREPT